MKNLLDMGYNKGSLEQMLYYLENTSDRSTSVYRACCKWCFTCVGLLAEDLDISLSEMESYTTRILTITEEAKPNDKHRNTTSKQYNSYTS